jgi:hypothetical protein
MLDQLCEVWTIPDQTALLGIPALPAYTWETALKGDRREFLGVMRELRGGYDDHRLSARGAHSGEGWFVFVCAVNIEFYELDLCLCSNRAQRRQCGLDNFSMSCQRSDAMRIWNSLA